MLPSARRRQFLSAYFILKVWVRYDGSPRISPTFKFYGTIMQSKESRCELQEHLERHILRLNC